MIYTVPSNLPKTPATIEVVQKFASDRGRSLDEVVGGILAQALNQANVILKGLGTVTLKEQLKCNALRGESIFINPIIDGPEKDQKGRMILFQVQTGQKMLNMGALSIMDSGRNGKHIEDVDILASRIALCALGHLVAEKLGVVDLDGLKIYPDEQKICEISIDDTYLKVDDARVLIDWSTTDEPAYTMLKAAQIKSSTPVHFVRFDALDVIMMHDHEINAAEEMEEVYFSCEKCIPGLFGFKKEEQKESLKHPGEYIHFFRLAAPAHVTTKPWHGDINALRAARLAHIAKKTDWKKPSDVTLYPPGRMGELQQQILEKKQLLQK